jgi:hypothetical protein
VLAAFGHPFQGREPQIMAPMHQALFRLAEMRGILAHADFFCDDAASIKFKKTVCGAGVV